jgi:hypothetical protein
MQKRDPETFNKETKQVYMDAKNARLANYERFQFCSDPILQQNKFYVSNNYLNNLNIAR